MKFELAAGADGKRLSFVAESQTGVNGQPETPEQTRSLSPVPPARSQVVALAFLAEKISPALITNDLARALAAETGDSVIVVRLEVASAGRDGNAPAGCGVAPGLWNNDGGFHTATLELMPDCVSATNLVNTVRELAACFRFVLVESNAQTSSKSWFLEFVRRSDKAYFFLPPDAPSLERLDSAMHSVRLQRPDGWAKPVVCLAEGETIGEIDVLSQKAGNRIHLYVHGCPGPFNGTAASSTSTAWFQADVRRLAREISGRLVGLALSSGAAKGFSHIGVIQVLEENGIEIDFIAGASMGAYVGSLWAYGFDGAGLERLARELEGRWTLWTLIDPVFPPRQGFLRGLSVKRRLMRSLGTARFADLRRPFRVVAGNLATLERVIFSAGDVASAVHASIAVPGICVPVTVNGETCIDGGIVDPLPVDVLRDMGVGRVIAVNAIPTPERMRQALRTERSRVAQNGKRPPKRLQDILHFEQQLNYFARGNLLEILMRSVHGAQIRVAEASCRDADVVLRPEICDDRWLDYGHPGKFIELGREVAERHLDEIKAVVGRNTTKYEREPAPEPVASLA
jgi:NTE family protein